MQSSCAFSHHLEFEINYTFIIYRKVILLTCGIFSRLLPTKYELYHEIYLPSKVPAYL